MSATKAFDLALFVPTPANVGDGVVVSALGPPFGTQFAPLVQVSKPGVVVGASMPAANAQNQILISGHRPDLQPLGARPHQSRRYAAAGLPRRRPLIIEMLMSDALRSLGRTPPSLTVMALGDAVTTTVGGLFVPTAKLTFQTSATPTVCIDGGDPAFSILDNFSWDAGQF